MWENIRLWCILLIGSLLSCHFENNQDAGKTIRDFGSLEQNNESELTNIKFDRKILNLDSLPVDSVMRGNYKFFNVGNHDLIIEYVNPDCTCTDYSVSSKILVPGDSGTITLEVDSKKIVGYKRIYAIVKANTPEGFHKLLLKGEFIRN